MPTQDPRTAIFRALKGDERLAALRAALRSAPGEEAEGLCTLLIELVAQSELAAPRGHARNGAIPKNGRLHAESVRLLATCWDRVPIPLRGLGLAAGRGRWGAALAGAEPGALAARGHGIAELAIDSCDPALLTHLSQLLGSGERSAIAGAAQAILAQSLRLTGEEDAWALGLERQAAALRPILDPEAAPWTPTDFATLLGVVAHGVEEFETHRRKELLLAALVLLEGPRRRGPGDCPLHRLLRDPGSRVGDSLRSALRRARAPIARRRAWLWLREPPVAAACVERLARAPSVGDHAAVLSLGHLALAPARARHLALIPIATRPSPASELPPGVEAGGRKLHPEGPAPDRVALQLLGFVARRRTPGFVDSLGADDPSRELALDPFLADSDPVARMAAARVLAGRTGRDFCFDGCEAVARHASLGSSPVGTPESGRLRAGDSARRRFAARLARSPHAPVRWVGREDGERLSPGAHGPAAALAARRASSADPASFADWVRDAVRSGTAEEAVAALMTCRRVRAVAEIEPLALSILRDALGAASPPPPRLVATAGACLGDLRAARVVGVLSECVRRHPDPRVRANAAEAIGRCRRAHPRDGVLIDSVADEHHRVRASAVRTLIVPWPEPRPGQEARRIAADALAAMLLDERSAHRLAGVWVVQRSLSNGMRGLVGRRWQELAARVRWLADSDGDGAVRSRACLVAGRLDAAVAGLGPRTPGMVRA